MISSQDLPPPVTNTAYGLTLPEDTPATHLFAGDDPVHFEKPNDREDYPIIQHPNGSEGWLPAEDLPAIPPSPKPTGTPVTGGTDAGVARHGTTATRRSGSAGSAGGGGGAGAEASLARASSRRSAHTTSDGRVIMGSAFVNGAGTTGPYATAANTSGDDDLAVRAEEANATLTRRQKSKIEKSEAKNGRKLSRIIKQEAKTEKKSLGIAIDELANLQKHQKNAVKSEARVQASHAKLVTAFKKAEAAYLTAKMQFEAAQGEMESEAKILEVLRANAREATEKVADKSAEVDALRRTLAVDEREREVKLGELKGRRSSFWG